MKKHEETSLGLDENVEALLSYLLGWLTGIIFLAIEKNSKFVRFHAMQSTLTFLGFTVLSFLFFLIPFVGFLLGLIVQITAIVVWIMCMLKAYQGEKFKLPITGDLSERLLNENRQRKE